ncbi:hypothetical protein [Periweissella fabalis]|uniref:Uncharacterized protein n=1 Tax=Periweissella fabalis TaxID=1070421 RepID=A0A7X6N0N5_9LACO|nr:hypothetical protein [Periweissella fabalis]MCM0599272.1 hypothetical protein [Periweissella fabalis]NKZ23551.1 hypothetical protein [Periweissella fabalis]
MKLNKRGYIIGGLVLVTVILGGSLFGKEFCNTNFSRFNKSSLEVKKGSLTASKIHQNDALAVTASLAYAIHQINSPEFKKLTFDNNLKFIKSQPSTNFKVYHFGTNQPMQPYFAITGAKQDTIKYFTSAGSTITTVKLSHVITYLNTNYSDEQLTHFTEKISVENDVAMDR